MGIHKSSGRFPELVDTDPEAEAFQLEGYRRMTAAEKLLRVQQLNLGVQTMALSRLKASYPEASERELRVRLASLWIPATLMREAFGWDPAEEGQ